MLAMEDEQYVTPTEPLGQNIVLFKRFQMHFFFAGNWDDSAGNLTGGTGAAFAV